MTCDILMNSGQYSMSGSQIVSMKLKSEIYNDKWKTLNSSLSCDTWGDMERR